MRGGWYPPMGFRASAWALCGGGRGARPVERCREERSRTWPCTHMTSFKRPRLSEQAVWEAGRNGHSGRKVLARQGPWGC